MIDCHAHLAGEDFDADRGPVRERAGVTGVEAVLVVGEDPHDNACRLFPRLASFPSTTTGRTLARDRQALWTAVVEQ